MADLFPPEHAPAETPNTEKPPTRLWLFPRDLFATDRLCQCFRAMVRANLKPDRLKTILDLNGDRLGAIHVNWHDLKQGPYAPPTGSKTYSFVAYELKPFGVEVCIDPSTGGALQAPQEIVDKLTEAARNIAEGVNLICSEYILEKLYGMHLRAGVQWEYMPRGTAVYTFTCHLQLAGEHKAVQTP